MMRKLTRLLRWIWDLARPVARRTERDAELWYDYLGIASMLNGDIEVSPDGVIAIVIPGQASTMSHWMTISYPSDVLQTPIMTGCRFGKPAQ